MTKKLKPAGIVAGFLEQFPPCGSRYIFAVRPLEVADQPGGEIDHAARDRTAELFGENKFACLRHRHDRHDAAGVDTLDIFPPALAHQPQPSAGAESFLFAVHARAVSVPPCVRRRCVRRRPA